MSAEIIITAIGVVVSVLLYFAGVKRGEHQERERQEHERQLEVSRQAHERELETDRQRHELQLEQGRREQEIVSKVADEYVAMAPRGHRARGTGMAPRGAGS